MQFFVNRDFERSQKPLVLIRELEFTGGFEDPFGLAGGCGRALFDFFISLAFIEADGGFKHQENIVAGLFDFTDGLGNAV